MKPQLLQFVHKIKIRYLKPTRQAMYIQHNIAAHSGKHCCNGNATKCSLCNAKLYHCQQHKDTECCTTMSLHWIYVIGNNEIYL